GHRGRPRAAQRGGAGRAWRCRARPPRKRSGARPASPSRRGALNPIERLSAARARRERLVIGLLSGTSADGTDAALCAIEGFDESTRLTMRAFVSTPFVRPLRERIFRVSE